MKAIELENRLGADKAASVTFAKDQPEYIPLPCLKTPKGCLLIGWKLTLIERIKLLFTGTIYHQILSFNQPLQPILLTVEYPKEWIAEK